MNELQESLQSFLVFFEPYSAKYFSEKIRASSKYPLIIGKFYRDLADFSSGGKRLRAFLVWLGYAIGLTGSTNQEVRPLSGLNLSILPICLAFEIIHSFLLIHDDIIDQSDKRRGKPTIHKRYEKLANSHYGLSQAMLIGDMACFEAFNLVGSSDFDDSGKLACQKKLQDILLETIYGEALDVEYSHKKVTVTQIWQMDELKTARYSFVGPLTIGAILGKAKKPQIESLTEFGLLVGTAFQLQDDILGVFGEEKILGKSVLSDLHEGKNTILIYKVRELVEDESRRKLAGLWGKKDAKRDDLAQVQKIIQESGALLWCQKEQSNLVSKAKRMIRKITTDSQMQLIFSQLADFVIEREK